VQERGVRCTEKSGVIGSGEDPFTNKAIAADDVGRESREVAFKGERRCKNALSIGIHKFRYDMYLRGDLQVL
jgi:hypothetical protein